MDKVNESKIQVSQDTGLVSSNASTHCFHNLHHSNHWCCHTHSQLVTHFSEQEATRTHAQDVFSSKQRSVRESDSHLVVGDEPQDVSAGGNTGALSGTGLETSDEPNASIGH